MKAFGTFNAALFAGAGLFLVFAIVACAAEALR